MLSGKTIKRWKIGVWSRWTGLQWIILELEYNYTKRYPACLLHICEVMELMKQPNHFEALFTKVLGAQKAYIKMLYDVGYTSA